MQEHIFVLFDQLVELPMSASDSVFDLEEVMHFPLVDIHYIIYFLLERVLILLQRIIQRLGEVKLVVFSYKTNNRSQGRQRCYHLQTLDFKIERAEIGFPHEEIHQFE